MSKALDRALDGENVKGRAAEKALGEAVTKIDRMKATAEKIKKNSGAAMSEAVGGSEVLLAGGLASAAAGYRGRDRMKIKMLGGTDVRTIGGLGLGLLGLGRALFGKKDAAHLVAVGVGVGGSRFNEWSEEMGQKWATPADGATETTADGKPVVNGAREITGDDIDLDLGLTPPVSRDTPRFVKARAA